MKNYVVTNAYLNTNAFIELKTALKNAFDELGEKVEFLTNAQAYSLCDKDGNGQPILFFDKDLILCRLLEKRGYRSVNGSKVIENCDDKAKTYAELFGLVPMPKTIIAPFTYENIGYTDFDFVRQAEEKLRYPVIIKDGKGSFGRQVYKAENRAELIEKLKFLQGRSIVMQEFIAESAGRDFRIYVVGGKAVAGGERVNENDFRSNVQSGGTMHSIDVNGSAKYKEITLLAEKTAKIMGADFAGVDILLSDRGALVCEVNSNAHFSALSKATGVDVAKKIVEHYLSLKK